MDTFLTNTFYIQLAQIIISVVVIATILRFLAIPIVYTGVAVGIILSSFDLDLISLEQDFNLYMNIGIFFLLLHAGLNTPPAEFAKSVKSASKISGINIIFLSLFAFFIVYKYAIPLDIVLIIFLVLSAMGMGSIYEGLQKSFLIKTPISSMLIGSSAFNNVVLIMILAVFIAFSSSAPNQTIAFLSLKVLGFLILSIITARYIYPRITYSFGIKNAYIILFIILFMAIGLSYIALLMGFEIFIGAYFAGLFIREEYLNGLVFKKVEQYLSFISYYLFAPFLLVGVGTNIDYTNLINTDMFNFIIIGTLILLSISIYFIGAYFKGLSGTEAGIIAFGSLGRSELSIVALAVLSFHQLISSNLLTILIIVLLMLHILMIITLKLGSKKLSNDIDYKEIIEKNKGL